MNRRPASLLVVLLLASALAGCTEVPVGSAERFSIPDSPDAVNAYHVCQRLGENDSESREADLRACVLRIPDARQRKGVSADVDSQATAPKDCFLLDSGYMGHGLAYVYACAR